MSDFLNMLFAYQLNIGDVIGFLYLLVVAMMFGYSVIMYKLKTIKRHKVYGTIIGITATVLLILGLYVWMLYQNGAFASLM